MVVIAVAGPGVRACRSARNVLFCNVPSPGLLGVPPAKVDRQKLPPVCVKKYLLGYPSRNLRQLIILCVLLVFYNNHARKLHLMLVGYTDNL